jgi:hypothetical protein
MKCLLTFFVFVLLTGYNLAQNDGVRPGTGKSEANISINNGNEAICFEDNMDLGDSASLASRGWILLNVDGGGTISWFQGNTAVFPQFEGAGYSGQNYNGANGFYIDQWTISPLIEVSAGDTISFYHRAPDANSFDDSIYVRLSTTGGTTPGDFDVNYGRFLVSEVGWAQWTGVIAQAGNIRFAIQYQIFDGGPNGNNSNYIGIDLVQVKGGCILPVELTSFSASSVNKDVILNWATATETNNSGFNIERKAINSSWETIGFVAGFGTTTETKSYSFADQKLEAGTYTYRLKQIDFDGTFEYSNEVEVVVDFTPKEYALSQNYPNPFNPETKIQYQLPQAGNVTIKIYNALGQEVKTLVNEQAEAGSYYVTWDGTDDIGIKVTSGVYLYRIQAGEFVQTKKMVITK